MGVGVPPTTAVISVGVRVAYVHAGAAHNCRRQQVDRYACAFEIK